MRAVSFYGFGGSYAVGLKNTGITLDGIIEPGGFGLPVVLANKEYLNFDGFVIKDIPSYEQALEIAKLQPEMVVGNPPCSGFSAMNQTKGQVTSRGPKSSINQCMWDLVEFAAVVQPKVVAFESVPAAYTMGKDLMFDLFEFLKERSGRHWYLQLVLMSGASVGNAQRRHRFFWVASQEPIGVIIPDIQRVNTIFDAIGDLVKTPLSDELQKIVLPHEPSPYAYKLYNDDLLIDGHISRDHIRVDELYQWARPGWSQRECLEQIKKEGAYGEYWTKERVDKYLASVSFSGPYRVHRDSLSRVISGEGANSFIHYELNRLLTIREAARLMGFPDDFSWGPQTGSFSQRNTWMGKQVPVHSWTWMLESMKRSLEGESGLWYGKKLAEDISLIDITQDYKKVFHERQRKHGVDSRSKEWIKHMESRVLA